MTDGKKTSLSTKQSAKSLMASPAAQSDFNLQTAIRGMGPEEQAQILTRANEVLALYFDKGEDPATKASVRQDFVRALLDLPGWAALRGFDEWVRARTRAPSPAEIRILAEAELKPITDEIAKRRRVRDEMAAEEAHRQRNRVSPEAAASIMKAAGFTEHRIGAIQRFPLATSQKQAVEKMTELQTPGEHWSDKADPDGPEWAALREARAKSVLVRPPGVSDT